MTPVQAALAMTFSQRFVTLITRTAGRGFRRRLSAENRLDAAGNREDRPVAAAIAGQGEADRRLPRSLDRQGDGAAVELVDDRRIAQQEEVEPRVFGVVGE